MTALNQGLSLAVQCRMAMQGHSQLSPALLHRQFSIHHEQPSPMLAFLIVLGFWQLQYWKFYRRAWWVCGEGEMAADLRGEGKRTGKGRGTKSENGREKEKEKDPGGCCLIY